MGLVLHSHHIFLQHISVPLPCQPATPLEEESEQQIYNYNSDRVTKFTSQTCNVSTFRLLHLCSTHRPSHLMITVQVVES